jgi:flagellar protein FliO/FliZ
LNIFSWKALSFNSHFARRFLALLSAATFSLSAFAADAPAPGPVIATSPMNMAWGIVFLLALVGAAWWLIRRSGGLQLQGGRGMKIIASIAVGPRERVVLIEIAGEQWLLGVAPGSVNLLQHFEQPIMEGTGADDFASRMRAVLQQGMRK